MPDDADVESFWYAHYKEDNAFDDAGDPQRPIRIRELRVGKLLYHLNPSERAPLWKPAMVQRKSADNSGAYIITEFEDTYPVVFVRQEDLSAENTVDDSHPFLWARYTKADYRQDTEEPAAAEPSSALPPLTTFIRAASDWLHAHQANQHPQGTQAASRWRTFYFLTRRLAIIHARGLYAANARLQYSDAYAAYHALYEFMNGMLVLNVLTETMLGGHVPDLAAYATAYANRYKPQHPAATAAAPAGQNPA
jgi:hypothetical protein